MQSLVGSTCRYQSSRFKMADISNDTQEGDHLVDRQMLIEALSLPIPVNNEVSSLAFAERCIDLESSVALNVLENQSKLFEVLYPFCNARSVLISDVDQQIIFKIFFKEPVTVSSLSFRADDIPLDIDASPPRIVHIWANRPEFDFLECDTMTPYHTAILGEQGEKAERIVLNGARFSRISSLQIFIKENMRETLRTAINQLTIWGHSIKIASNVVNINH